MILCGQVLDNCKFHYFGLIGLNVSCFHPEQVIKFETCTNVVGYLRYVGISIRSKKLTAFPKAVEWCDYGARYHNLEDLLHEVLVKART
jgi:hypothetical protein